MVPARLVGWHTPFTSISVTSGDDPTKYQGIRRHGADLQYFTTLNILNSAKDGKNWALATSEYQFLSHNVPWPNKRAQITEKRKKKVLANPKGTQVYSHFFIEDFGFSSRRRREKIGFDNIQNVFANFVQFLLYLQEKSNEFHTHIL